LTTGLYIETLAIIRRKKVSTVIYENVIDGSDGVATLVLMSGDNELRSKPQVIAKITRNMVLLKYVIYLDMNTP
jgi:hypothetical protein